MEIIEFDVKYIPFFKGYEHTIVIKFDDHTERRVKTAMKRLDACALAKLPKEKLDYCVTI